jgi:hypothetical protein
VRLGLHDGLRRHQDWPTCTQVLHSTAVDCLHASSSLYTHNPFFLCRSLITVLRGLALGAGARDIVKGIMDTETEQQDFRLELAQQVASMISQLA